MEKTEHPPDSVTGQPKTETEPKQNSKRKIILIVLSVIFALALAGGGWALFKKKDKYAGFKSTENPSGNLTDAEKKAIEAGKQLSGGQCEGIGNEPKLSVSPMKAEDFSMIIPYGLMVGDHVTPIDHQYFSPADYDSPRDAYEVRAMADGFISSIGRRDNPSSGNHGGTEYRLHFTQTCSFQYYYDLVTGLAPDLKAAYDQNTNGNSYTNDRFKFYVKAGQVIGYIGGRTLDFAVWDTTKPLSGFIKPESYKAESWKLYTADPLNYYTDELRAFILTRYVRDVEPISGKIDYDQNGKLIGNWFLEGTNGYAGRTEGGGPGAHLTHLSFSPEHLDPSHFVVSIGSWDNGKQFIVKGNAPWPANVTPLSGLIKYELVEISYTKAGGGFWDRKSIAKGIKIVEGKYIKGTVLVQMLEDGKVKFEAFPGKTASQVSGFTAAASVYTR